MYNRLKFVIVICLLLTFMPIGFAQSVSYTHKPLAAEGCSVKYYVNKQDSLYFIIVQVESDRLTFGHEPTMLLKTFSGDIIKLSGHNLGANSESAGGIVVNANTAVPFVIPISQVKATSQFQVTEEQLALISKGISKVRISTVPIIHEKEFNKDKIGGKIYGLYEKCRDKFKDF